jgi:hypothetical protein
MKSRLFIRVFEAPNLFGVICELLGAVVSDPLPGRCRRQVLSSRAQFVGCLLGCDRQVRSAQILSPRATMVGLSGPSLAVGRGQDRQRAKDGQPMSTAQPQQPSGVSGCHATWLQLAIKGVAW